MLSVLACLCNDIAHALRWVAAWLEDAAFAQAAARAKRTDAARGGVRAE